MSVTTVANFAWSFSALRNFETCARRYYEYSVAKSVKEPETGEIAFGNSMHKAFENRVKAKTPLPVPFAAYEPSLGKLADAPGKVFAERKLALTSEFRPTTFFGAGVWFRQVIDYTQINKGVAVVIDYKTGKPGYTDQTQLQLSALTIFAHDQEVQRVRAALLYVMHNHKDQEEYVRDDVTDLWSGILPRVGQLASARAAQNYPPKPGPLCKRWCAVTSCPFNGK